jgi:hypothetical protein
MPTYTTTKAAAILQTRLHPRAGVRVVLVCMLEL